MKETLKKRKELELVAKKVAEKEYVKQFVLETLLELKNEKKREAFIKDLVKTDVLEYSVKNKIDLNNKQDIKKVKNFMNLKLKEHNDKIASLVINPQMLEAMKEGYKTLLKDTEFLEQQKMKAQKQRNINTKSGLRKKEEKQTAKNVNVNSAYEKVINEAYEGLLKEAEFLEQQKMKAQKQHDVSKKNGLNFDKEKKEIGGDVKQNTADISTHILDQDFGL